MKKFITSVLKLYKMLISDVLVRLFGFGCRFTPTCSEYAITAIEKFGVARGVMVSLKRISRCHPFTSPGYDPVPTRLEETQSLILES